MVANRKDDFKKQIHQISISAPGIPNVKQVIERLMEKYGVSNPDNIPSMPMCDHLFLRGWCVSFDVLKEKIALIKAEADILKLAVFIGRIEHGIFRALSKKITDAFESSFSSEELFEKCNSMYRFYLGIISMCELSDTDDDMKSHLTADEAIDFDLFKKLRSLKVNECSTMIDFETVRNVESLARLLQYRQYCDYEMCYLEHDLPWRKVAQEYLASLAYTPSIDDYCTLYLSKVIKAHTTASQQTSYVQAAAQASDAPIKLNPIKERALEHARKVVDERRATLQRQIAVICKAFGIPNETAAIYRAIFDLQDSRSSEEDIQCLKSAARQSGRLDKLLPGSTVFRTHLWDEMVLADFEEQTALRP
jgi:hypothetical protein